MIHVCFAFWDERGSFAKFAGTSMLSVFENISRPLPSVTVHILHDDTLTDENRNKFSYLAGRYGQIVKFYNVEKLCAEKLEEMTAIFRGIEDARFNKAVLYKFFIPQVLSADVSKAIYLEPTVIVNQDISELWRVDLNNKILGVVPALSIGSDVHTADRSVADGFVKKENYFSSGVMLMNVNLLRAEEKKLIDGLKFAAEKKYFNLLDQTVLNYCFASQTMKLPANFNCFVRMARKNKEDVEKKIYYYTSYSLQLDMSDPFNLLWMNYLAKTPWFDAAAIGKLYESFQQVHARLKKSLVNLSGVMAGKTRAFCATPDYVDELKKVFFVRDDEELILLENQSSFQKLFDSMRLSHGKKVFFIMAQNFPFGALARYGFVFGRDFLNALEFLSEEQGISMNSYPLLYAM